MSGLAAGYSRPMEPQDPSDSPSHPPFQTALLLIGVLALLIGLAALSTFG